MLKHRHAHYGVGRTKDVGVWWKWIDPMSVDAVLIYAPSAATGGAPACYTDYTFAVWNGPPGDPTGNWCPLPRRTRA